MAHSILRITVVPSCILVRQLPMTPLPRCRICKLQTPVDIGCAGTRLFSECTNGTMAARHGAGMPKPVEVSIPSLHQLRQTVPIFTRSDGIMHCPSQCGFWSERHADTGGRPPRSSHAPCHSEKLFPAIAESILRALDQPATVHVVAFKLCRNPVGNGD